MKSFGIVAGILSLFLVMFPGCGDDKKDDNSVGPQGASSITLTVHKDQIQDTATASITASARPVINWSITGELSEYIHKKTDSIPTMDTLRILQVHQYCRYHRVATKKMPRPI